MSATRLGVSVEKVVATIETPSSHQGWRRPAKKNDEKSPPARLATRKPTNSEKARKHAIIAQSTAVSCMRYPISSVATESPLRMRGETWRPIASLYAREPISAAPLDTLDGRQQPLQRVLAGDSLAALNRVMGFQRDYAIVPIV